MSEKQIFLGFDSSTQSLKATAIDPHSNIVFEHAINFDTDLPQFNTNGGVHKGADNLTVTSPTLLWVAALDKLLNEMKEKGFAFEQVTAISGSGQQHGSVFWKTGAKETLSNLDASKDLETQLANAFSISDSPIWMDSSTSAQCEALENALGGPQEVANLTGSRAYERFTGNQIAKIYQTQPEAYENTERISLVSSFIASIFLGQYAPIDTSDGAGMNLMNIKNKNWVQQALETSAPNLAEKLGKTASSHTNIGKISNYFSGRYGFDSNCEIITFSGDNPNSLAALQLQSGDVAISLGTSDTVFAALAEPKPSASEGHIFASPIDPEGYMALVCYKNGSLTREWISEQVASKSWEKFNNLVAQTTPGNNGNIGFYLKEPEITPPIMKTGAHRFDVDNKPLESFSPEVEARAVLEGQFLSMRLHGSNIGIVPKKILATGGASVNPTIIQIIADVFGAPVHTEERPNSASLGAAYRALHGWQCKERNAFIPFSESIQNPTRESTVTQPNQEAHEIYSTMLKRYQALENALLS